MIFDGVSLFCLTGFHFCLMGFLDFCLMNSMGLFLLIFYQRFFYFLVIFV
ncbi:hypothetical protein HanIR_Chr12g0567601 [Helianthus annuus]|nr:hypothetical protein HanIR_Chr12g0567601 [Helianthus annuus]